MEDIEAFWIAHKKELTFAQEEALRRMYKDAKYLTNSGILGPRFDPNYTENGEKRPEEIPFGPLTFLSDANILKFNETGIFVTPTEKRILKVFAQDPDNLHTFREISDAGWGENMEITNHTIQINLSRLRKKIRESFPTFKNSKIFDSVSDIGYILNFSEFDKTRR